MTGAGADARRDAASRLGHPLLDGPRLLEGRCVVLTGAAGGIGRSIATALACAGATVAATDIDEGGLARVAAELGEHAEALDVGAPLARAFDAADEAAFEAFVADVAAAVPRVDGLVNCAGAFAAATYDEIDGHAFQRSIQQNLTSAFNGCRAVLPLMTAQGSGSVVNVASTAGEFGSIRPASHYAAAKGGVIGLTKSLAREVGEHGVRVNALSPGPTDTIALGAATPEQKATAGARTLFNRLGRPEEIAYAAVFLLSDLSTFVTGHLLGVNGGSRL